MENVLSFLEGMAKRTIFNTRVFGHSSDRELFFSFILFFHIYQLQSFTFTYNYSYIQLRTHVEFHELHKYF